MTDGRIVSPFWAFEGKERGGESGYAGEGGETACSAGTQTSVVPWQVVQVQNEARRTCENANMTQMMVCNSSQILDVVSFSGGDEMPEFSLLQKVAVSKKRPWFVSENGG